MVETELQAAARGKDEQEFGMAKLFKQAHESGQIQSTEELGRHLMRIIQDEIAPGRLVNYAEYGR
ncbi:hypothetical protein D3C77_293330 [compost metagenome]